MARVFTIGHSTRPIGDFLALLAENGVQELVDVRRYPGSRRYPHFSRERLQAALGDRGIAYRHEPDLGGHRDARPDSPHTAWRVTAFRGYADHMASPAFQAALQRVVAGAATRASAVMCAEALPERCHRQLIADALLAGGSEVLHIVGPGETRPHVFTPTARIDASGAIVYDRPPRGLRR
jgi:uncharacterized protein (DUF488 family)